MSDNIGASQNPEQPITNDAEKGGRLPEATEAQTPGAPQGSALSNDQAKIASITQDLNQPSKTSSVNTQPPPAKNLQPAQSDDTYIKAAEKVIDKDKGDPYQEEEDHETVQAQYLKDRFGKDLKRG